MPVLRPRSRGSLRRAALLIALLLFVANCADEESTRAQQ